MSNLNKVWTKDYVGFESILDFDEEWGEEALPKITPNSEYMGIVRITFEYIPTEDELANDST